MAVAAPTSQSPTWHVAAQSMLGDLNPASVSKLAAYRDLILIWNARFNLTALKTAEAIDSRLILDALRLIPVIGEGTGPSGATAIDIGSGAGTPGLPIAIVCPAFEMTMIEATGKKARFIQEAIEQLGLPNARAIHGRAEDLAHQAEHRESYDLALARAVGSLPTLLELSIPLVRPGGKSFFPKGALDQAEIAQASAAAQQLGGAVDEIVALPDIDGCPFTQVVIADKIERVPARFPRRAGIPAKEPLGG